MLAIESDSKARAGRTANEAERTCAGCRAQAARNELMRFAWFEGQVPAPVPDLAGKLGGRGVWVHPLRGCLAKAARGGFARALKAEIKLDSGELTLAVQAQLRRRLEGLILAALRQNRVAVGTDAVQESIAAGTLSLLLVAKDAAGRRDDLLSRAAEATVPCVVLEDKMWLGRLTGRQEVGTAAILDPRIAREVAAWARWLTGLSEDG